MDTHETEELANSTMWNSALPDPERSEEKLPEDDGSEELPKEGGDENLPEEVPTVDTVEKVDEVPQKAVFVVQATTSQVSLGSALPQEKVKLAYRLLGEVLDQGSSQPRTTQS